MIKVMLCILFRIDFIPCIFTKIKSVQISVSKRNEKAKEGKDLFREEYIWLYFSLSKSL